MNITTQQLKEARSAYDRATHEHAAGWEERCLAAAAPFLQNEERLEMLELKIKELQAKVRTLQESSGSWLP